MDFSKDTDADLLGYMAMASEDPEFAQAAWGEFFTRNRGYLFGIVRSCYGRHLGGDEGAADLVSDTFQAAYAWAGRHGHEPNALDDFQDTSPQLVQRRVRAWLGTIAENRFKDSWRRQARQPVEVEHSDDFFERKSLKDPSPLTRERLQRLEAALATLSEQDQQALRVSLPWYDDDTQKFNFGPGEAETLAAELGTTVDALRQRRHRALQRLKKAMTEESAAPPRAGTKK